MASREDERGITIVLVAVVIVVVLGMAALAIDLTALYVSHGQAQRAADAAALAGAKMFVTSGFTSNPSAWTTTDLCQTGGPGAAAAANQQAEAAAGANRISGQPVSVQHIACNNLTTTPTNPQITVRVQQAGLPSYFARIWGQQSNSVGASATAEAYNPSGSTVAVQTPVKPWLIPNCDPDAAAACSPLINVVDGSIANNGSFIGESISLTPTNIATAPNKGQYYALDIGVTPPPLCPSSSAVSCGNVNASAYTENVACASQVPLACGLQAITLEDIPGATTSDVAKCMIHARDYGPNQGQDTLTPAPGKVLGITGGDENPDSSLRNVPNISRSDSIVTLPIYDGANLCPSGTSPCSTNATVLGFLQIGVGRVSTPPNGKLHAVILNVAGCPPTPVGNAVSGDDSSPVATRLIR